MVTARLRSLASVTSPRESPADAPNGASVMTVIKADLAQLDDLSRRFDAVSRDVEDLRSSLTALINSTEWTGARADQVHQIWEQDFRPAFDSITNGMNDLGRNVQTTRTNIDQAANTV